MCRAVDGVTLRVKEIHLVPCHGLLKSFSSAKSLSSDVVYFHGCQRFNLNVLFPGFKLVTSTI